MAVDRRVRTLDAHTIIAFDGVDYAASSQTGVIGERRNIAVRETLMSRLRPKRAQVPEPWFGSSCINRAPVTNF
jgi:hypothetical protein